jgi:hypothetical protein
MSINNISQYMPRDQPSSKQEVQRFQQRIRDGDGDIEQILTDSQSLKIDDDKDLFNLLVDVIHMKSQENYQDDIFCQLIKYPNL